jgi:hypothetical protein
LERLEAEEEQVKKNLADIAKRQAPVERVSDDARSFLETWQDIGELLRSATPEERMQILQHYIEVIELGLIDRDTRTGSYAMRLFPEVRPDRGFDFGSDNGPDDGSPAPETTNGDATRNGCDPVVVNPGRLGSHNRPKSSPKWTRRMNNLPVPSIRLPGWVPGQVTVHTGGRQGGRLRSCAILTVVSRLPGGFRDCASLRAE